MALPLDLERDDIHNATLQDQVETNLRNGSAVDPELVSSVLMQSGGHQDLANLENSDRFVKVAQDEFKDLLDFVRRQNEYSDYVIVAQEHPQQTVQVDSQIGEWIVVDGEDARRYEALNKSDAVGFFSDWPTFGVYSKMLAVVGAATAVFCYGFKMGASKAMESLYRLSEKHPVLTAGVGLATTYAVSLSPEIFVKAVQYVVIGGVVGGTAMATPVFVVGTSGVFVASSVYHTYILTKRLGQKATGRR
eukprot:TRINITY_DN2662_c0_g1_i1.p1 TRINITY_DN2662_c0_g1~~TRINITY_DN2662_c0_g1_i1.p1  ORF type:complete len:248 (+),score=57.24 TRINITY_DN2662_c0_g1_i1:48-791(+)